jgi:hypothetical protein
VRRLLKGKKGQVLVISIAALLVVFILTVVVVETGNLVYQKVHMQNIADSGSVEAGLWYARSLNVLSLSNKVLALAGVAGIVGSFLGAPEAMEIPRVIQKMQDAVAGTGVFEKIKPMPLLAAAAVVRNGSENGVISIPLFNVADFQDSCCLPSFNVERRYLTDVPVKKKKYSIKGRELSEKDSKRLQYESKIRNRKEEWQKVMYKNDEKYGTTYVKAEEVASKADIPLDIKETDDDQTEHTVLVFSFKKDAAQLLNSGFLADKDKNPVKPSFLLSTAMVRIGGGSLDIFDMAGANFSPKLDHVMLPAVKEPEKLNNTLSKAGDIMKGTGLDASGSSGGLFGAIGKSIQIINSDILLH